jgi:hypothetical protein
LISPQSRKGREDKFSFHLPLRGPAEAGCKQRQMKNNQPPALTFRQIKILNKIHNSWPYEIEQFEAQLWVLPAGLGSFYLPASQRQIKNKHSLRLGGEKNC